MMENKPGTEPILDLSTDNLEEIERKAFLSCKSLKKVILPESIKKLGDWCFSKCSNLKSVEINAPFSGNIFGKGVFEGCDNLCDIRFQETSETLSKLLATTANRLSNDHLLRSDDLGQQSWYEKWDIYLLSILNTDDAEGSLNVTVCGEEDISYDGIGSIDGEMPGETGDYIKNVAKNKCFLCFLRLTYDDYLSPKTAEHLKEYIKDRSFGNEKDYAWLTLKEDCEGMVDYYRLYLSIVTPTKEIMEEMIADLSATQVQAKAFLINEASCIKKGASMLDDLMI